MAVLKSIPEEVLGHLYTMTGMIVTNWSFLENALDHWTAITFQDFRSSEIESKMPRMLGEKIKFLSKCFRRIDGLAPFREDAMKVISRCEELSDMRHYVVHGVLSGYDAEDNATFVFRKIDVAKDKKEHVLGEMRLPANHLISAGTELINMAHFAQTISAHLIQASERER